MQAVLQFHFKLLSLMPMATLQAFLLLFAAAAAILTPLHAGLVPDYLYCDCPRALSTIRNIVQQAILNDPRNGASLLRLHFHDCFVNGCDGSVLLDDTANFTGEKTAFPNLNSLRALDVVDKIKSAVNQACNGNVVSCADILAVAARDSVSILGGALYTYTVYLGRNDSRTASKDAANTNLPPPFFNSSQLLSFFQAKNLTLEDLVALSGGHTIGLSRCVNFRDRIYNDTNIDPNFANSTRSICPQSGGDDNTSPLDSTTGRFDTRYFADLINKKGLLHSDQQLYQGDGSLMDQLVQKYRYNPIAFASQFAASMVKMGNMKNPTDPGEIRMNCRVVNPS